MMRQEGILKKIIGYSLALGLISHAPLSAAVETSDTLYETMYKTCRDLHGDLKQQEALMGPLVESAAAIYQVDLKQPGTLQNVAWLIRTGCSVWPDTYLSAIAAKAIRSLGQKRKPAPTQTFPHADRALTDCELYEQQTPAEQKALADWLSKLVTAHDRQPTPDYWTDDYLKNSIHNACQLVPSSYVYEIIGHLHRTAAKAD